MTKGPNLGENKYKTAFFQMSDYLYELLYLILCKHVVDVFSPIIVIVASRNIIFFVLMKKNFKCEWQYFTFLMTKSWKTKKLKTDGAQSTFFEEFCD